MLNCCGVLFAMLKALMFTKVYAKCCSITVYTETQSNPPPRFFIMRIGIPLPVTAVNEWFLKVSKCYPLDAELANQSVVEVANYRLPLIFNTVYMGIPFTENNCLRYVTAHGKQC